MYDVQLSFSLINDPAPVGSFWTFWTRPLHTRSPVIVQQSGDFGTPLNRNINNFLAQRHEDTKFFLLFTSHQSPVTFFTFWTFWTSWTLLCRTASIVIHQSPVTSHQSRSLHFGHRLTSFWTPTVQRLHQSRAVLPKPPHEPVSAKLAYLKLCPLPPLRHFG